MSALEPLRFSILKQMAKSPAHAKWALDHEAPDTPSMRIGRLAHSVFLGKNVPTVFDGTRRGKEWTSFKEAHEGEDIVTVEEFERAGAMASSLHSHSEARHLLMGQRERTVLFDFAGRPCRATPDVFSDLHLTELKTTSDASPMRFPFTATRLAYHAQLTWQKDGLKAAGAADPKELSIVAIETKAPYAVAVFRLTERAEDFGRRQYIVWLEEFLNCERSNHWGSYLPGVLDAPNDAVELIGSDGDVMEVGD
jgi:hypothetical protein